MKSLSKIHAGAKMSAGDELKGELSIAVESFLGTSYSPVSWVFFGHRNAERVDGVCPVVWVYASCLYSTSETWFRKTLVGYAKRIACSSGSPRKSLERARDIGNYTVSECFRLSAFSPVKHNEKKLIAMLDRDPVGAARLCLRIAESIQTPPCSLPFYKTAISLAAMRNTHDSASWHVQPAYYACDVTKNVAREAQSAGDYFAAYERAVSVIDRILT